MSETTPHPVPTEPTRRGFVAGALAIIIGGIVSIAPLIPGAMFFLDPLLRKKKRPTERPAPGDEGFVKVGNVKSLPADGTPQLFTVYDDKQDAWNFFPAQQVGSVWLRKVDGKDEPQCFNSRCPHLGCTVDYKPADKCYFCPCHTSTFDLDGKKMNVIPPRGMDDLEVKTLEDGTILVRFKNFRAATSDKEPVG